MFEVRRVLPLLALILMFLNAACLVGPKYSKPAAAVTPAFKEQPPPEFKEGQGWKLGDPKDDKLKGKWWEIFNDPELNALEEQVQVSNQNVAQADAVFREARDAIRIARSSLFPTVTGGASITSTLPARNARINNGSGVVPPAPGVTTSYQLPVDLSYEVDIWGRVRRTIEANVATAQASAADLENVKLSMQAELASDYFQLRGLDAEKQLLDSTVIAYEKAVQLTNSRHDQGIASGVDVAQAESQVEDTKAQAIDLGVERAQFEHAIAVLTGKAPATLTLAFGPIPVPPPVIPVALPSELLERRPDVAGAERRMAAANAEIGVAKAAFYPTVSLTGSAGLSSSSIASWFTWPSRFWSLGPSLSQTLFDAGRRRAITDQAQAAYDSTVAVYRQNVLTAFQDVEDNLAALRILAQEAQQEDRAVKTAQKLLELAENRYKGGVTAYLEVITAQAVALTAERTQVQLQTRRMAASVLLVKAVGGDWNQASLPSAADLQSKH